MKLKLGAAAVLAGLAAVAGAAVADQQMQDVKDMEKPAASAPAAVHKATGVVKNVKPDRGAALAAVHPARWRSGTVCGFCIPEHRVGSPTC